MAPTARDSASRLVHFLRPSADLLLESVAASFKDRAIAVVLTGTGSDGSAGLQAIKKMGGTVIAQDEGTSEFFGMPGAAMRSAEVRGKHLMNLSGESAFEQLTVTATNRRGRKIDLAVSCMPFALGDNPSWGAIVTMEDKTPSQPSSTPSTHRGRKPQPKTALKFVSASLSQRIHIGCATKAFPLRRAWLILDGASHASAGRS